MNWTEVHMMYVNDKLFFLGKHIGEFSIKIDFSNLTIISHAQKYMHWVVLPQPPKLHIHKSYHRKKERKIY